MKDLHHIVLQITIDEVKFLAHSLANNETEEDEG